MHQKRWSAEKHAPSQVLGLLGSRARALCALAACTVTIERFCEREHHQPHHHREWQRPDNHGAFQSFHRIGARIALARHQQCADHGG